MAAKTSASILAEAFGDTNLSTEDRISKAKVKLYRESPFYSYLVTHLNFKESTMLPTMGVTERGTCYYNSKWVDSLTIPQLIGVIAHEVQHLALRHHQRCNNRNILVNGSSLWNIAIDISDNFLLVENHFELPKEGIIPHNGSVEIYGTTVSNIGEKSSEEIYEELKAYLKTLPPQPQDGQGDGKGKGGISVSGNGFDNVPNQPEELDQHLWGDKDPEGAGAGKGTEGELKEGNAAGKEPSDVPTGRQVKDWDKIFHEAYNHAKLIGREPAGMARQMDEIHKGRINWRAVIRRLVASKLPYDLTYRRPNKKYLSNDAYMPSFAGETIKVICSLDTSGSISKSDITDFMSEIISLSKSYDHVEFRVLTHDVTVHDDVKVNSGNIRKLLAFEPHGGGGTDSRPLYDYIRKHRYQKEMPLLISFTDGYTTWPEKPVKDFETIVVLAGGHIPKEQVPSWILTITME